MCRERGTAVIRGKSRTLRIVRYSSTNGLGLRGQVALAQVSPKQRTSNSLSERRHRPNPAWLALGRIRSAVGCHRDPGTGRGGSCRRLKRPTFGGGLSASPGPVFHLAPPGSAATSAKRDSAWPGEALRRVLLPGTGAKGAPEATTLPAPRPPPVPPPRTRRVGEAAFEPNGLSGSPSPLRHPGAPEGTVSDTSLRCPKCSGCRVSVPKAPGNIRPLG